MTTDITPLSDSDEQAIREPADLFADYVATLGLDPDAASDDTMRAALALQDALAAQHAELTRLRDECESLAKDAERWRRLRPCLQVEGSEDDDPYSQHVQFLIADDAELSRIAAPGWTHTVESLVDASRLLTEEETPR